jgi:hypothetical protein
MFYSRVPFAWCAAFFYLAQKSIMKNPKFKALVEASMDCIEDAQAKGEGKIIVNFLSLMSERVYGEPGNLAKALNLQPSILSAPKVPRVKSGASQLSKLGQDQRKNCATCPDAKEIEKALPGISTSRKQKTGADRAAQGDFQKEAEQIAGEPDKDPPQDAPDLTAAKKEEGLPSHPSECRTLEQLKKWYGFGTARPESDIAEAIKADLDLLQVDYSGRLSKADSLVKEFFSKVIQGND